MSHIENKDCLQSFHRVKVDGVDSTLQPSQRPWGWIAHQWGGAGIWSWDPSLKKLWNGCPVGCFELLNRPHEEAKSYTSSVPEIRPGEPREKLLVSLAMTFSWDWWGTQTGYLRVHQYQMGRNQSRPATLCWRSGKGAEESVQTWGPYPMTL